MFKLAQQDLANTTWMLAGLSVHQSYKLILFINYLLDFISLLPILLIIN
uniref:Uncharacterized protein n=1 Tax=Anguilla anguilla TaxID=7936 RepID=A0A0E9R194_ANGAN